MSIDFSKVKGDTMMTNIEQRINLSNKMYPLYDGLSKDLLFYIAIDTLFLTVAKGFSAFQISFLSVVPSIVCICMQPILIKIIRDLGNVNSSRLGTFMLLLSSIIITFGQTFVIIAIGQLLYDISFVLKNMESISLKNNLKESVSFDSHYVYAKNVYKEYLRVLKRSYDEAILYCAPKDYSNYLVGLIKYYQKLLDDVLDGESDKHLFWNLRNATTHNQIEFKDGFIRFYITGKHIHLYHYHKKKKEWVPKDFSNNETIWEMKIKEEELLHLLDLLSKYQNIPTSINISKLKRRKKDVSPHLIKQHE